MNDWFTMQTLVAFVLGGLLWHYVIALFAKLKGTATGATGTAGG